MTEFALRALENNYDKCLLNRVYFGLDCSRCFPKPVQNRIWSGNRSWVNAVRELMDSAKMQSRKQGVFLQNTLTFIYWFCEHVRLESVSELIGLYRDNGIHGNSNTAPGWRNRLTLFGFFWDSSVRSNHTNIHRLDLVSEIIVIYRVIGRHDSSLRTYMFTIRYLMWLFSV